MNDERKEFNWVFMPVLMVAVFYTRISLTNDLNGNCDMTRYSNVREKNGTIQSPRWPDMYGPNLRCVYHLIGLPHERVQVKFQQFDVKGVPPRCLHDYVDVYTQIREPFQDLLDVPLHGRYCGNGVELLPRLLISMHNVFVVAFYSDQEREERGFQAVYSFIDGSIYNVGTPAPANICGQTIYSVSLSSGIIVSPTYPGIYPDNVYCFYRFHGVAGQRVRLTFIDVDLYSGGEHCPYDFVRAYDGADNSSETIGTYCGRWNNSSIFSSGDKLYLEFITKSGRSEPPKKANSLHWETQEERQQQQLQQQQHQQQLLHGGGRGGYDSGGIHRRGFKAAFKISDEFVDLGFIRGQHVRGTECDQLVLSSGESSGTISSPNYPRDYPLNITCHYYIDGLVDTQNLEKARLIFDKFDMPTIRDECDNGFLRAYVHGQEMTSGTPDQVFCGRTIPSPLVTSNPRLLLVFNTTNAKYAGGGFQARYQFLTDYAIPGTPATDSAARCHFLYYSQAAKHGAFNSPRHPSNYPDNTSCLYEFHGVPGEQVRITFENFKVEDNLKNCGADYVQVYSIASSAHLLQPSWSVASSFLPADLSRASSSTAGLLIGHYCGDQLPGPQLSEENSSMLHVLFTSNHANVSTGFRARYEFVEKKPFSKRCYSNNTAVFTDQIISPNYPHKYFINSTCEWLIYTKNKQAKISLFFDIFQMEGHADILNSSCGVNVAEIGCGNAVLKVYANMSSLPSHELCGIQAGKEILSQENLMRLKFISSARAIGAKGFKLTWTEVLLPPSTTSSLDDSGANKCFGFRCKISGYCIDSSLRCNKMHNCGNKNDTSDEEPTECGAYRDHGLLHIILIVVGCLVVVILIVVCVLCRRHRSRQQRERHKSNDHRKNEHEVRYVARADSNCTPVGGAGASQGGNSGGVTVLNSRSGSLHRSSERGAGRAGTTTAYVAESNHKLLKEKTEKVSIV